MNTANAETVRAYNPLKEAVGPGNLIQYVVEDGSVERNGYLAIAPPAVTNPGETRLNAWKWCTSLSDPTCNPSNYPKNLKATSILPPCDGGVAQNCIEGIEFNFGEKFENAELIRITKGLTFAAEPKFNFLGSSNISLWQVKDRNNQNVNLNFAAMGRLQSYFINGKFRIGEFFADITPFEVAEDPKYSALKLNPDPLASPENRYVGHRFGQVCVFEEDGICGVAKDFPNNVRIRMKLRLSNEVGGWFRGRISDPKLVVTEYSETSNLISLEADPVRVSRMALQMKLDSLNAAEQLRFENMGRWPTEDRGTGSGPQAGIPKDAFPFIEEYRERVKDRTAGSNTYWNISTTSWGKGSSCLEDTSKVLGIVSTNALAYDGSSPSFDGESLLYKVSGLHFQEDGLTPVYGSYDLLIRSETARCLYNFSKAPISATVQVFGENGTSLATTSMSEKDNWVKLSAKGFTFSQVSIKVKLTQVSPIVPKTNTDSRPGSVQGTATANLMKQTITCIKGKTIRKISGFAPKCPVGFKKKTFASKN